LQPKEKNKFASAKDNRSMDYSFKEKLLISTSKDDITSMICVKKLISKHAMHLKFGTLVQVLIKLD